MAVRAHGHINYFRQTIGVLLRIPLWRLIIPSEKNEGKRLLVSGYSSNHGGYHLAPVKNAYIVTWPLFRTWQPTYAGKRWGVLLRIRCRRTQENCYPDVKDFVFDRASH